MARQLVIFDGDDTLWFVEPLYDQARQAAAVVVEGTGLDPHRWEELQRRIDVENVESLGVSATRFPKSSVTAYQLLADEAGRPPEPAVEANIRRAAESVFSMAATPAAGVQEVLEHLRTACDLALLTKGDSWVQEKRIADAGLASEFALIRIVPEKGEKEFRDLLIEFGVESSQAWSVGNSLASDINPALRIGMTAIWIDAHVWEHERREPGPTHHGQRIIAPSLQAVPDIILGSCDRGPRDFA
jgi:putative hydrolase of the HAD superfamily